MQGSSGLRGTCSALLAERVAWHCFLSNISSTTTTLTRILLLLPLLLLLL
jgi:hypothetical protein